MIISPLKVWVQNILPVVYDDSLSYLEIVAKINAKTNEIISQTNENTHAIETLANTIAELGDIDELRALLDEMQAIVEDLYTTDTPLMDGTASAGSADHASRSDHIHPTDTSRAPINHATSETTYGIGDANNYGHVKITDNIDNIANGTAVKASVVKTVNNKLNTFTKDNILDDWYFVGGGSQQGGGKFPINQRGQTSYSINASSFDSRVNILDRWAGVGVGTITLASNSLKMKQTGGNYVYITQLFENLAEGVYTLSVLLGDGTLITGSAQRPSSGNYEYFGDLNTTYAQFGSSNIAVITKSSTDIDIIAVKLELGDTQTLAHNEGTTANPVWVLNAVPDYGLELLKCQRYLQPVLIGGAGQGTLFPCNANFYESATAGRKFRVSTSVRLSPQMRAAPTAIVNTLSAATVIIVNNANASTIGEAAITDWLTPSIASNLLVRLTGFVGSYDGESSKINSNYSYEISAASGGAGNALLLSAEL